RLSAYLPGGSCCPKAAGGELLLGVLGAEALVGDLDKVGAVRVDRGNPVPAWWSTGRTRKVVVATFGHPSELSVTKLERRVWTAGGSTRRASHGDRRDGNRSSFSSRREGGGCGRWR